MTTKTKPIARTCVAILTGALTLPLIATPASATGVEVGGSGNTYYLTNNNDPIGERLDYGKRYDQSYVGDFNGNNQDTIMTRRGNTFFVKHELSAGNADQVFAYGKPSDTIIVGDWDGDGIDTPAVRRGNQYLFTNRLNGGVAEFAINYGRHTDQVLVGDWDNDGKDTLAIYRDNKFYLANTLNTTTAEEIVSFGNINGTPIAGSWDGGADQFGIRNNNYNLMINENGTAVETYYGKPNDNVLIGDWDGDGTDTLGVRRDHYREAEEQAARELALLEQETILSSATAQDAIMKTARGKLGSAYVYGASGPDAYDCSGFTRYVYDQAGISLPRSSTAQRDWAAANGTEVSLNNAQPGDLLWWPGHVGIYAGNGKIIDAGTPATGVSERNLYGSPKAFRIA